MWRTGVGMLVLVCATRPALAERSVHLDYRASANCPSRATFVDRLSERVGSDWASDEPSASLLRLVLDSDGPRTHGLLEYVDERGETVRRELEAADCQDLFAALLLVTSLTLTQLLAERPAPPPPIIAPLPDDDAASPSLRPARAAVRATAQGRALVAAGIGPELAFGGALYSELGGRDAPWLVRFGVGALGTSSSPVAGGRASFWLQYLELGGCIPLGGALLRVVPCALGQVGVHGGRGEVTPPAVVRAAQARRLWLALALEPRLELGRDWFSVHLATSLTVPLRHEQFTFASPERKLHEVPLVAWALGFGAGIEFP